MPFQRCGSCLNEGPREPAEHKSREAEELREFVVFEISFVGHGGGGRRAARLRTLGSSHTFVLLQSANVKGRSKSPARCSVHRSSLRLRLSNRLRPACFQPVNFPFVHRNAARRARPQPTAWGLFAFGELSGFQTETVPAITCATARTANSWGSHTSRSPQWAPIRPTPVDRAGHAGETDRRRGQLSGRPHTP